MLECLVAFAIVVPLGLGLGFLVGESRRLERVLGPALQILLTVPKSIFLPVFVLMLGIGFAQKVVFAVAIAFFIVVPTGIAAVHSVSRPLVAAVESFGATRTQIYLQVYLPAMAPLILGGVRLGLIFTVHGVVFAEMYGASAGVGRNILLWGEQFQMDYLLAAVLLVVAFTIVLNELMQLCEVLQPLPLQRRGDGVNDAAPEVVVARDICKRFATESGAVRRARRRVARGARRRVRVDRRSERLRQVDFAADHRRTGRGDLRARSLIDGERVDGPRPDKIGIVFQEPLLLPWKTAAENIEFPLALRGEPADQRRLALAGAARSRRPARRCRALSASAVRRHAVSASRSRAAWSAIRACC